MTAWRAWTRLSLRRCRWLVVPLCVLAAVLAGVAAPVVAQAAPATGPADAQSAGDAVTASAIAAKYGHDVAISASTTETTQAAALPDGTFRYTATAVPTRVLQGSRWVDVDTSLQKAADGNLSPVASPAPVEFSAGGSGALARVQTNTGRWVSIASPFGALPAPTVAGATATYGDVLPGVDLVVSASAGGMSEVLSIKDAQAAADPRLAAVSFQVSGATVAAAPAAEAATATVGDGSTVVTASPMWWDARSGGTPGGPGGAGLTQPVSSAVAGSTISVDAAAAARAAGVQYPVYVDPDFTGGNQAGWTFVDSDYPNSSYWEGTNHGSDTAQHAGYIDAAHCGCSDGAHTDRSYWNVDTSGIVGKHILSAHFDLTQVSSSACTSNAFQLNVSAGITPSTTWNTKPYIYRTDATATFGPQRSGCAGNQSSVAFDGTAFAIDGTGQPQMTVEVRAVNEGDFTTWRRFGQQATLTATYNTPPSNPTNPVNGSVGCSTSAPGPVLVNTASHPLALGVDAADADGNNLTLAFDVAHPDGSNALDASAYPNGYIPVGPQAPGHFTAQLPTSLGDGSYMWNAHSWDGYDWSPGYSALCYFQVHNEPPGTPTLSGPSGTQTVGTPMSVAVTPASAADGVVGYAWTWQAASSVTAYSQLPPCSYDTETAGLHYMCATGAVTLSVAPIDMGAQQLTVWAVNAAGQFSPSAKLAVTAAAADPNSLYPGAHQWTTDLAGPVPAASCPSGTSTVACLADNNVPDPTNAPNGAYPLPLPSGATVDGSGNTTAQTFVPPPAGVLNFPTSGISPAISAAGTVVDTTKSFTVAAWITPKASTGGFQTAVSERGTTYSGFYLQLTPQMQWKFDVHSTANNTEGAVITGAATIGQPVFAAGVYDAANHEIRFYLNGATTPAGIVDYWPDSAPTASGGLTVGSAWWGAGVVDYFVGQVANPVVVEGVLTPDQLRQLGSESFFPSLG